jgi:hypothetical protein
MALARSVLLGPAHIVVPDNSAVEGPPVPEFTRTTLPGALRPGRPCDTHGAASTREANRHGTDDRCRSGRLRAEQGGVDWAAREALRRGLILQVVHVSERSGTGLTVARTRGTAAGPGGT